MNPGVFDTINTTLVFWEAVSFLVLMFLALLGFSATPRWSGRTGAREALDRRYASGGLTREEYLTIRDDITRNPDA